MIEKKEILDLLDRVTILESSSPAPSEGDVVTTTVGAAETLLASSMVIASGFMADSSNMLHMGKIIGMNTALTNTGFSATVVIEGVMATSLSYPTGTIMYLNGTVVSNAAPTVGWSQVIGVMKSPGSILVNLGSPILL